MAEEALSLLKIQTVPLLGSPGACAIWLGCYLNGGEEREQRESGGVKNLGRIGVSMDERERTIESLRQGMATAKRLQRELKRSVREFDELIKRRGKKMRKK